MVGLPAVLGMLLLILASNQSKKPEGTEVERLTRVLELGFFGIGMLLMAVIVSLHSIIGHLKG